MSDTTMAGSGLTSVEQSGNAWRLTFEGYTEADAVCGYLWPQGAPDGIHIVAPTVVEEPAQVGIFELTGLTVEALQSMEPSAARAITEAGVVTADAPGGSGTTGADEPPPSASLDQITDLAARSAIARYSWKDRGVAPSGYIKGMALVYARVYAKLKASDEAAVDMAQVRGNDAGHDALAWYEDVFAAADMSNDSAGTDTLRHLFVLLIGLGMRESSGKYCEGRDTSATNTSAETAEAGLFQTSFNARHASPLMPTLFAQYTQNPSGFVETFKEGVRCSAANLENFGSGDGMEFQRLSKECPAFAAEFAAVGLRHLRTHWGPINRKGAEIRPECDAMLRDVEALLDASEALCSAVQV